MPAAFRPPFSALWDIDLALADVVATSTDPTLGAVRLAWWRERLDDLDIPDGPRIGEPRLAAADQYLAWSVTNGVVLSELTGAWLPLLHPFPWDDEVAEGLRERGRLLFRIGGRILGYDSLDTHGPGALWSLVDGALHCSDAPSREFLLTEARKVDLPRRMPRALRPLTVLAAVAASDARGRGQLARAATAFWHRSTGRFPQ